MTAKKANKQTNSSEPILRKRDWSSLETEYKSRAPFSYVVIDNFLVDGACEFLHRSLVAHWGWRQKNWISDHLHNHSPDIPGLLQLADDLRKSLPGLFNGLELVDFWALMYRENKPGRPHSDNAEITSTLWLTPDCYNLDPNSGGLMITDVLRDPNALPHEHLVYPWADEYFASKTNGDAIKIPYRQNRAVLFDAKIFHRTDDLNFNFAEPSSFRINLSFAFDGPDEHMRRQALFQGESVSKN
jgi:hypothetical protein